ncbi:hypothetical protein IAR55_004648 [Kwoniella newhampshirensis]|uniref:Uncharacterized protein n=1 Tax=Kwoniella newhampshirensis TaxID=1651941 RepID=A0AAW0YXP4_9TREE
MSYPPPQNPHYQGDQGWNRHLPYRTNLANQYASYPDQYAAYGYGGSLSADTPSSSNDPPYQRPTVFVDDALSSQYDSRQRRTVVSIVQEPNSYDQDPRDVVVTVREATRKDEDGTGRRFRIRFLGDHPISKDFVVPRDYDRFSDEKWTKTMRDPVDTFFRKHLSGWSSDRRRNIADRVVGGFLNEFQADMESERQEERWRSKGKGHIGKEFKTKDTHRTSKHSASKRHARDKEHRETYKDPYTPQITYSVDIQVNTPTGSARLHVPYEWDNNLSEQQWVNSVFSGRERLEDRPISTDQVSAEIEQALGACSVESKEEEKLAILTTLHAVWNQTVRQDEDDKGKGRMTDSSMDIPRYPAEDGRSASEEDTSTLMPGDSFSQIQPNVYAGSSGNREEDLEHTACGAQPHVSGLDSAPLDNTSKHTNGTADHRRGGHSTGHHRTTNENETTKHTHKSSHRHHSRDRTPYIEESDETVGRSRGSQPHPTRHPSRSGATSKGYR